jgi:hypothetical protein
MNATPAPLRTKPPSAKKSSVRNAYFGSIPVVRISSAIADQLLQFCGATIGVLANSLSEPISIRSSIHAISPSG